MNGQPFCFPFRMLARKIILLLSASLLLAGCVPSVPQQDALVLINGTLIDGTGADPVPDAVLVIRGERIEAAGPEDKVKIPDGARIIDAKGASILPGFINAHVHFGFREENLQAWAYGGVTTVRDEGILSSESLDELMAFRDSAAKDPMNARLISAGYMISVPNGYGDLSVDSPEDARNKVFEELDAGVDMIKISMEDGYAGTSGLPKLTDEELAAIITATHERGTRVSGHITQAEYLKVLVEAGVDDIAHIAYDLVPEDVWEEMVAKDIYLVPTFTVFRNYSAPMEGCALNLRNFIEHGGKVALGNDYGGGPGKFELGIPMYEIEQMSEAGMTPMQIILASTKNAAYVLGIEDEVGTLEAGKFADVLVVSGNPLEDLQDLTDIRMVIHNGTIIRDGN
jgi:imidazolonepropionase-like amidohydrolase